MMRSRRRALVVAIVLVCAIVLAVPAVAHAAGSYSGDFREFGPNTPIPRGFIGLYEVTAAGGLVKVDSDVTNAVGAYGPLTAADAHTGQYHVRAGRPGFKTYEGGPNAIVGAQNLDFLMEKDPMPVERTWGNDRYSTAVNVARARFTSAMTPQGWWGVETVVIASGEDRAAADPLAAAGLCGAYGDTPLLLVSSTMVPGSVKAALGEISATRKDTVHVVVVGGPASVPDARLLEISDAMPHGVKLDRVLATGNRFNLAAAIAGRIATVKGGAPAMALVANGADPEKFFDALALSTVSASVDIPILLVNENSVPAATKNALDQLGGAQDIAIGGGPATVSQGVMNELDQQYGTVERWAGSDRYWTAIAVANNAIAKGMLEDDLVGVAAKLPDALTGGATIGQTHGVLLITNGETLTPATGNWLAGHKAEIGKVYVVGGPVSVTPGVMAEVNSRLQ